MNQLTPLVPGVGGLSYEVIDRDGRALGVGDTVMDFRGNTAELLSVAAAPAPGKTAKVTTTRGTHYATVYSLTVTIADIKPSSQCVPTKEAAKMLRQGLRNQWPSTTFRVRMGRGTAATWLDVEWIDGPTDAAVASFGRRYQGSEFNGITDSYDRIDARLIALEATETPVEMHFHVRGINTSRLYSPAAWAHAQDIIDAAGYPEFRVLDDNGHPNNEGNIPDVIIGDREYRQMFSPIGLAQAILRTRDLTDL